MSSDDRWTAVEKRVEGNIGVHRHSPWGHMEDTGQRAWGLGNRESGDGRTYTARHNGKQGSTDRVLTWRCLGVEDSLSHWHQSVVQRNNSRLR